MRARWYRKEGSDARSAVMYVHGGGMILMGIDEMDADISRYVALSGVPFLSIGYRLAPEHPRPQAEDALDGTCGSSAMRTSWASMRTALPSWATAGGRGHCGGGRYPRARQRRAAGQADSHLPHAGRPNRGLRR